MADLHTRSRGCYWQKLRLCVLLFLLPSCNPLSWILSAPTISKAALGVRLSSHDTPVLFDLRNNSDFVRGHVPTSRQIAFGAIGAAARLVPKSTDIVLVCQRGHLAALAVSSVRGVGHERVVVLDGGWEHWSDQKGAIELGSNSAASPLPTNELTPSPFDRALAYAAGVVIKPIYMLMSLGLILWLKRPKSRELRRLQAGIAAFLTGEAACLFNFYVSDAGAPFQWLECLHELGMAVGSAYCFQRAAMRPESWNCSDVRVQPAAVAAFWQSVPCA